MKILRDTDGMNWFKTSLQKTTRISMRLKNIQSLSCKHLIQNAFLKYLQILLDPEVANLNACCAFIKEALEATNRRTKIFNDFT